MRSDKIVYKFLTNCIVFTKLLYIVIVVYTDIFEIYFLNKITSDALICYL